MLKLIGTLSLLASLLCGPAWAEMEACPVPPDLALTGLSLPVAAKAVAERRSLTIVALGGASTAGSAAVGKEYTYPERLAATLRQSLPGTAITIINRGASAVPVRDRMARIDKDLAGINPDLVIWAPGATEAGVAEDPDRFQADLADAAARIRATGADLLLVDLQYTPRIAKAINLLPYDSAIARIAGQYDLGLLRRAAIMRSWQESGVLQLDGTPKNARVAVMRRLYTCVAQALADGIAPALKPPG